MCVAPRLRVRARRRSCHGNPLQYAHVRSVDPGCAFVGHSPDVARGHPRPRCLGRGVTGALQPTHRPVLRADVRRQFDGQLHQRLRQRLRLVLRRAHGGARRVVLPGRVGGAGAHLRFTGQPGPRGELRAGDVGHRPARRGLPGLRVAGDPGYRLSVVRHHLRRGGGFVRSGRHGHEGIHERSARPPRGRSAPPVHHARRRRRRRRHPGGRRGAGHGVSGRDRARRRRGRRG